jgi:type IV pilus assembly protein PilE
MKTSRSTGFTLIELMIVVAIVAILAAIAYPSYTAYAFRSRRADGREMIMRVAAAQERYYTSRNAYTTDLTALGFAVATNLPSEKGDYTISSVNGGTGTTQSFLITGTPVGLQAKDSCAALTISSTGLKDWTGVKPPKNGACW